MPPKAKAKKAAPAPEAGSPPSSGPTGPWTKPRNRAETDEAVRVLAELKPFAERGRVDVSLISKLLREVLKGTGAAPPLCKKLVAAGKEGLPGTDGEIKAGELTAWYFENAWPAILEARAAAAAHAKRVAEMQALEQEQLKQQKLLQDQLRKQREEAGAAAGESGDELPDGGELSGWGDSVELGEGRDGSGAVPSGGGLGFVLAPNAPAPIGWQAARSVEVIESRRVVDLFSAAVRHPRRGSIQAGVMPPELLVPSGSVKALLREALAPIEDDELLATLGGADGGVPLGALVRFWFDAVWPKHGAKLREQRKIEFRGALSTSVEWGDVVDPIDAT